MENAFVRTGVADNDIFAKLLLVSNLGLDDRVLA